MTFLLLFACITGKTYPDKNAEVFCETLYLCIENDLIELALRYDNEEDCIDEVSQQLKESDDYKDWETDTKEFNKENAKSCLAELTEVQSEAECDGTMDPLSFTVDVSSEDCFEVYQ